ncbi:MULTISPECIES: helix-turn-helix domain-containing protein [unclassified Minwuia]|jgi:DNA-binding HxlR family transcriptional regulator|uniref:winged helix-turn-helix transcriptional regulator n=1 Tax=unclassified Minwuia TaxID=2618799 RepID=UPI00247937A4|nr:MULTISPECIES: helix-turn-helix domain-containing protein [unclassified Minwuia]
MRWNDLREEACPVARGLSVVGDRWTMLILRDCFQGIRRFEQMQERLGITRHVLSDRLKKLESAGVLRRVPYQQRPPRHEYRLTETGTALYPVLATLIDWANTHVPAPTGTAVTLVDRETGVPVSPKLLDTNTGREITHRSVGARMQAPADDTGA